MAMEHPVPLQGDAMPMRVLPSGRMLLARSNGSNEEIEIRSPTGEMEICITLTDQGPRLTLRGARLEIDSTDTIAVKCRKFELQTSEGLSLQAQGGIAVSSAEEVKIRSTGKTYIDAEIVNLNCLDRQGRMIGEVEG